VGQRSIWHDDIVQLSEIKGALFRAMPMIAGNLTRGPCGSDGRGWARSRSTGAEPTRPTVL